MVEGALLNNLPVEINEENILRIFNLWRMAKLFLSDLSGHTLRHFFIGRICQLWFKAKKKVKVKRSLKVI